MQFTFVLRVLSEQPLGEKFSLAVDPPACVNSLTVPKHLIVGVL